MLSSSGTDEKFDDVMCAYGTMVYRLAFAQVRNRHDADDVFQEVFLRYFKKQGSLQSDEHRKAWLIRVTINCSRKLFSTPFLQKTAPLDENLPFEQPEELGLHEALCKLPPKYRAVLHLFYYEDMSVKQIAAALKRREPTIRSQLTRGRALLKEILKGEGFDEEDLSSDE